MRITLGVTGGVAAYKAAELVRRLQQDGFSVQVVMTRGAREFVTPLTFASLRSAPRRSISRRSASPRSGVISGFTSLQAFHASTPCWRIFRCGTAEC